MIKNYVSKNDLVFVSCKTGAAKINITINMGGGDCLQSLQLTVKIQ